MEKIVIAPQIVVYRNAFTKSKKMLELLEIDNDNSFFSKWVNWETQGLRKKSNFSLKNVDGKSQEELECLKEFVEVSNYIKKDYFSQFNNSNGTWPYYVKDWKSLRSPSDNFMIEHFKYDSRVSSDKMEKLMMEFHVDEYLLYPGASRMMNVATLNYYLNDDYDGGEICAFDSVSNKSYKYKPFSGDAVIMPSTVPFYHGVMSYSNADRYFMRIFFQHFLEVTEDSVQQSDDDYQSYVSKDLQIVKKIPENMERVIG